MKALFAGLFAALSLLGAAPAIAHSTSTSFLDVELPEAEKAVELRWDLSLHDLVWTVFIDRDFDGAVTWREVQDSRATIEQAVLSQLAVTRGGEPCALRLEDLALAERLEQNHLSARLTASCPRAGRLAVGGALFMSADASQRMLVRALRGEQVIAGVVSPGERWEEPERISAWRGFVRFVGEGVWHVLIGYDHIAFVLLLLLPSVLRSVDGRWRGDTRLREVARDILLVVTAFTVAHSTTLALAATGTVRLPTQPIEIAQLAIVALVLPLIYAARATRW